jgi:sugar fermentation stimulation protein A
MENSGIYLLVIHLPRTRDITIGKRGTFRFRRGYYLYVGSAQRNLRQRIERHTRKTGKKLQWHIDYLLQYGSVRKAVTFRLPKECECALYQHLAKTERTEVPVADFGSSDCNCRSHLLFLINPAKAELRDEAFLCTINKAESFAYKGIRHIHRF